jgi:predicted ATPase
VYQGDTFSEMSPGKRAFVILRLLLEFGNNECPILIDQPEDSLDNRAIFTELVQYLRDKKKKRQIILVTHNPNVVVGADAEQVIVANQTGSKNENIDRLKFSYTSGALENSRSKDITCATVLESQGIREHVCEILEGGEEAFKKRENKYGFSY